MHIYCITNLVNGKIYIGQHAGDDLDWYFRENLSAAKRGSTSKTILYNAIRKHGTVSFKIQSLVNLPFGAGKLALDSLEQFFIKTLKSQDQAVGYNITAGGGGVLGLKFSEETKEKLRQATLARGGISEKCREAQKEYLKTRVITEETCQKLRKPKGEFSEEHCQNISKGKMGSIPWNKGLKLEPRGPRSDEVKKKISEANMGRVGCMLGKHHSEETKAKMSASHKGKKHGPLPEETKAKLSAALKGRKTYIATEETKKKNE